MRKARTKDALAPGRPAVHGLEKAQIDSSTFSRSCSSKSSNSAQQSSTHVSFLTLDPHPFPDVIYWASDSKQLVIARPEEIYGFARVYPGRQFKDPNGNILDASVWAHPTLQRLSTPEEVAAVKRRAAPKLFRTRRLANGDLIRTKAGPKVERKFKEIKHDMATERRIKNGWGSSQDYPNAQQVENPAAFQHWSDGDSDAGQQDDARRDGRGLMEWLRGGGVSWEAAHFSPARREREEMMEGQEQFHVPEVDPHHSNDDYRHQLPSIPEGQYISPVDNCQTQDYSLTADQGHQDREQGNYPPNLNFTTQPPFPSRFHRSCPASIHTSPILSAASLPNVPRQFPPSYIDQPMSNNERYNVLQLRVNTHVPQRIAAPAAVNPFLLPSYGDAAHPALVIHHFDHTAPSLPSAAHVQQRLSADTTPSDGLSREGSVWPDGQSWEQTGAIDPRWVSPRGSTWNTPAATPRSGSPGLQVFPESQIPRGLPGMAELPSFQGSYGGEASSPIWGHVEGGMRPPPLPQHRAPLNAHWII